MTIRVFIKSFFFRVIVSNPDSIAHHNTTQHNTRQHSNRQMNDNASAPTLIEPGVRYFLSKSLEQCHKVKDYYHSRTFNFTMGAAFFICLGVFLYIRYKGKPSPEEVEAKKKQQQEYILSKLKMINATHYAQSKGIPMDARTHPAGNGMGMLTNLPLWKSPDEDYWKRSYA